MPSRPKKQCNYPKCANLIKRGRYCKEHEHLDTNTKFRNKQGKSHEWYYTPFWRKIRKRKLAEQPLCEYCQKHGAITPANTVDHYREWKTGKTQAERWKLFSDWDNLKSSCASCHNSKTARKNR